MRLLNSLDPKKFLEGFLTYMGMVAILVMCPWQWIIYVYIGFPFLQMLDIKFDFDQSSSFREDL